MDFKQNIVPTPPEVVVEMRKMKTSSVGYGFLIFFISNLAYDSNFLIPDSWLD